MWARIKVCCLNSLTVAWGYCLAFAGAVMQAADTLADVLGDPNFKVELTYEKNPPSDPNEEETYGAKDSIRLDVYYRLDKETVAVCVAELKTGRRVLSFDRMLEIIDRTAVRDRNKNEIQQMLVTEMRPKNAPAGRRLRGPK